MSRLERRPAATDDNFRGSAPVGMCRALEILAEGTATCEWCQRARAIVARPYTAGIHLICEACCAGTTFEAKWADIEEQGRAFKRANPDFVTSGW